MVLALAVDSALIRNEPYALTLYEVVVAAVQYFVAEFELEKPGIVVPGVSA